MSATNITPVYTELDEQRFKLWLTRLEDSYKTYLSAEDSGDTSLLETIKTTIKNDIESYPQWITHHKNIPMGRMASSCEEMKTYLRHVALPHVIAGYRKIVDEICPAVGVHVEHESKEVSIKDEGVGAEVIVAETTPAARATTPAASATTPAASATTPMETSATTDIAVDTTATADAMPESETVVAVSSSSSKEESSTITEPAPKTAVQSTLVVPIHTAPISKRENINDTTVEDFFRGLASGKGDSMVNLCKLADISHRINRAEEHDAHQVAHWIQSETSRRDENQSLLARRQEKLEYLRGEDEGRLLEQSVSQLQSEVTVLTASLMQAEREEEEARKIYEAAMLKRKTATQTVVNLNSYIDNVATQRDLLRKVNDLRIEADKYNIASAEKRMTVYNDLSRYVAHIRHSFVQQRLAEEMPAMFDNLVAVFNLALSTAAAADRNGNEHSSTSAAICNDAAEGGVNSVHMETTGETAAPATATITAKPANAVEQDKLSLYCAARVGLETIRIWQQLNLHIAQPALVSSINEFEAQLTASLAMQTPPSPQDSEASEVYQASNTTVVLYFDHLQHDTPEDHVEAQSRVLTCLKMLTDHLVEDPPHSRMEVENTVAHEASESTVPVKTPRTMKLLNCNDILSPPVWCLPLAHSPQYLAQLWRLAEEAHSADLLVPLEFDTEWISEDPYRSGHSDEEDAPQRIRTAPGTGGTLLKSVDLEEPWQHALDEKQINAFTQLLTPAPSDHMVAKVIKRMETKAAQKANRNMKLSTAAPRSSRAEERAERNERLALERQSRSSIAATASDEPTSLSSTEGLSVITSMGIGTVIRNYRSDGIISVNLKWGAVGHFRTDCVQTCGNMGQMKVERPIYSAAQAFYVSGSAGRFVHNDMQLHNTMCRLITLVKVQRIVGDLVQINHANLSLYMHGRTSSGLTKTIEATITRWLEKFDQQKLADMLDEAEKSFNAGTPVSQQNLFRMLEQSAMPPGQVSWVRSDRTLGSVDADGATTGEYSVALSNTDLTTSLATKSKSNKINEGVDNIIPDKGCTSFSSPTKISKETRNKVPVDLRTLPKYTKEGETLRELMLSIMRTLKLSQGSLANIYYRNYRFETSQGGVSAWFHFRGHGTVFESMNHCALMWVDDNKKYLNPQEQALFVEASSRMNQPAGVHSNHAHAQHTRSASVLTPAVDVGEAATVDTAMDKSVQQVQTKPTAGTITAAVQDGQVTEGSNSSSTSLQAQRSQNKPAVAVADESSRDDRGLDGDVEDTGSLASESGDDDYIGSSSTMDVEMQSATTPGELPTKRIVSGLCIADQSEDNTPSNNSGSIGRMDTTGASAATNEQIEGGTGVVVKEEEASVPVTPTEYSPSVITTTTTTTPATTTAAAPNVPVPANMTKEEIRTIEELHAAVIYEMNRRKVSQSRAAVEARLRDLGMGQPALSKFLSIASINNNERGKSFCDGMIQWVNFSRSQPAAEGWDPAHILPLKAPPSSHPRNTASASGLPPTYSAVKTSASVVEGSDNYDYESDTEGGSTPRPEIKSEPSTCSYRIGAHVQRIAGPDGRFPDNEELLTCGLCGKPSSEFNSNKSFRMHLAWCYRRKNQTHPPPDHMLRGVGMAEAAAWEPSDGSRKRKSGSSATTSTGGLGGQSDFAKRPRIGTDESLVTDANIVAVDAVRRGFHHDSCELCKEHGDLQRCASCPCVYHARCSDLQTDPESAWYCPKCVESGASSGAILSEEDKNSPTMTDRWILVYSDSLRRWRKAVVLATHSERSAVVLAKWWRSDNKGGKTNWLDLSKGDVLSTTPEKITATRSRSSTAANSSLTSGYRDRNQVVRFDPTSTDRKTSSASSNARFKTGQNMMLMDGEHGGSVPPLVRAAADGIGGVAALQDGDYPDNKSGGGSAISGNGMSDTYISSNSLKAALCAAGSACRAVDIALCNDNTNVFACTRPPGHHAGRYGCTSGCLSTGFCMLNNAAMAAIYARVRWGLERVAVVDIDVHFGNGTAELLRNDPNAFFASVHMIYGEDNDGLKTEANKRIKSDPASTLLNNNNEVEETAESKAKKTRASESLGFYPARMGLTEVTDTYVSVGVYPTLESAPPRSGEARRRKKVVLTYDWDSSSEEEEMEEDEEGTAADTLSAAAVEGDTKETSSLPTCSPMSSRRLEKKNSSASMGADTTTATATAAATKRPLVGSEGFLKALQEVIIPQMEKFRPQLLVISAGFDGYVSDPLGGQLCLSLEDYKTATKMLMHSMDRIKATESNPDLLTGKVISLLEGGYDTSPFTLGLAKCVDAHVEALQEG